LGRETHFGECGTLATNKQFDLNFTILPGCIKSSLSIAVVEERALMKIPLAQSSGHTDPEWFSRRCYDDAPPCSY
jgi:hypothetical protein